MEYDVASSDYSQVVTQNPHYALTRGALQATSLEIQRLKRGEQSTQGLHRPRSPLLFLDTPRTCSLECSCPAHHCLICTVTPATFNEAASAVLSLPSGCDELETRIGLTVKCKVEVNRTIFKAGEPSNV